MTNSIKPSYIPKLTPTNMWKSTPSDSMSLFVLSYIDGKRSVSEIASLCAKSVSELTEIINKFKQNGLIQEEINNIDFSSPFASFVNLNNLDLSILKDKTDLNKTIQEEIFFFYYALENMNPFQILGLDLDATDNDVKRSYQKLTIRFHPDRFYGKNLGKLKDMPTTIFKAITKAFSLLSNEKLRKKQAEIYFKKEPQNTIQTSKKFRKSKNKNKILKNWINSLKEEPEDNKIDNLEISDEKLKSKKKRHRKFLMSKQIKNRKEKAEIHFQEAKKNYSTKQYVATLSHLKTTLIFDPNHKEAKELYDKVKPIAEDQLATSYFNKAKMEEELGNLESSANLYTLASEILPSINFLLKASQLQAKIGSFHKAKELALQAISIKSNLKTELNFAEIYIIAKMYNRAKSILENLQEKYPNNPEIKKLFKKLKKSN